MATRTATRHAGTRLAPGFRATTQRDMRQVDTTDEEQSRFAGRPSALTKQLQDDMRRVKVPTPEILDPDTLADAVREREADERARHAEADRRARRAYDDYLAGRGDGKAEPEPQAAEPEFDHPARNPVRDRLEREAAVRNGRPMVTARNDHNDIDALDAKARTVATQIRTIPRAAETDDRESTLLTDRGPAPAPVSQLTARRCTLADVDRLWDWIRQDPDLGARFVGTTIQNSQQLHTLMVTIAQGEQTRASVARSVYFDTTHVGFAVLLPVLLPEKMAGVHLYLRQDCRGQLANWLPSLLQFSADAMPDIRLAVMNGTPAMQKLLEPYGFVMHTVYVKER